MLMELAKLAAVQGIMDVFAAKVITSLESIHKHVNITELTCKKWARLNLVLYSFIFKNASEDTTE